MRQTLRRASLGVLAVSVASSTWLVSPAGAAPQTDAGSGRDAGNTFDDATKVKPRGFYEGRLDGEDGDNHDYFKFFLPEGGSVSVLVDSAATTTDPMTLLDPSGNVVDVGTRVQGPGVTVSSVFTSEVGTVRLAVHKAVVAGQYRLHLQSDRYERGEYGLCFMNCEEPMEAPIDLIFGGSLETADARVLLVPPMHGDLGNPLGPTVVDYMDATLRGIDKWIEAMDDFAKDYPQFAYLATSTSTSRSSAAPSP